MPPRPDRRQPAVADPAATSRRRPIRVCFLIGSLDVGGAERQLVRLANSLDPDRFAPSVVTMFARGPLERELRPGIPVTNLSLQDIRERRRRGQRGRFVLGLRLLARMHRQLRRERPDILHAYLLAAYVLGALTGWTARVPVIVAGRRGLTSYHAYETGHWRMLARLANRIVAVHACNSEAAREYAIEREGLRREWTVVIRNGIDLPDGPAPELEPAWSAPAPARAAMIANLSPHKGHATVLRAVRQVLDAHPGLVLVLFGDGRERPALERLRDELGLGSSIVFAGRRVDAHRFLPGFDLLVLASTEESAPNAVMEAMAAGVPTVATAVGGVPELIREGVDGLLVPVSDAGAMAGAIAWMLDHPDERRRMGAAARERVSQFSTRRMVTATEDLYESLVRARRGGGGAG